MSTTTDLMKDATVTTATAEPGTQHRMHLSRPARRERTGNRGRSVVGLAAEMTLIRVGTVATDALVALFTATSVLPVIGVWLRTRLPAGTTVEGLITLWGVPFGFLAVLIAVAEIAGLRGLWRAGRRDAVTTTTTAQTGTRTTTTKRARTRTRRTGK
ncbi:hypothetical protein [Cutibacterium avidum]|uniref:hypothetical protein n=1 Tax=Cutibacterium avidum TaxID=33010 RepID=UPI002FF2A23E